MYINESYIIGIGGPSCSGKSILSESLIEKLDKPKADYLSMDSYYKDLADLPLDKRNKANFDSPQAFDIQFLIDNLQSFKNQKAVECPIYDFSTHTRSKSIRSIDECDILILDGILVLAIKEIRDFLDFKIYIDIDTNSALDRRIKRDVQERGRTKDSVIDQFNSTVLPMYKKFIEPSKNYADLILDGKNRINILTDRIVANLKYWR